MAELNARIIAKASATAAEEPLTGDLEVAELAVNTADGKLFTKHTDGSIVTISGGGGLPSYGPAGDVLASDGISWASVNLPALLAGGTSASPDILLNFDGDGGDYPVLDSAGMTTAYPSTDSKFGSGAATFDRVNQDFLQGSWSEIISTRTWTLSFWIKTSDNDYSVNTSRRVIAPVSGLNLDDGFQIMRESGGSDAYTPHADNAQGALMLNPGGTKIEYLVSTRTFSPDDGLWHYVVFQHEGSGIYSCFYDGTLTERRAAPAAIDFGSNGGFFIGKRSDSNAAAFFTGTIDGVSFTLDRIGSSTSVIDVPSAPPALVGSLGSGANVSDLADVSTSTPADGEVLTWVDANSQWEPVAPGGGGAVDSVNDQTGVVSLGIQDMDDYILRSQGESVIATWSGTWTIHTLSNNQCSGAGEIGPGTDNGNGANICIIDGDGNDRTTELDAFANSSLWFSVNGGLWTEATTGNIISTCTPTNKLTGCPDLYTAINAAQVGDTISLSDGTPPSYIPLTEGDVLQWNDTDQKFKPAQPKERIQDMDDFQLQVYSDTVQQGEYNTELASADDISTTPGGLQIRSATEVWFGGIKADGTDWTTSLDSLTSVWMSINGAPFAEYTSQWGLSFSPHLEVNANLQHLTGTDFSILISIVAPASIFMPLSKGDMLTYNSAIDAWTPVQIPPISYDKSTSVLTYNLGSKNVAGEYEQPGNQNYIYVNEIDANGRLFSDVIDESGSPDIYVTEDNINWNCNSLFPADPDNTSTSISQGGSDNFFSLLGTSDGSFNSWTLTSGAALTGQIKVSTSTATPPVNIDPSEGDTLQWDDSDQKFKPAAPTVSSVNGQKGNVSLGIQEMDDYGLNLSVPSLSIEYDNNIGTAGAVPGGAGNFSPYDQDSTTILLMVDHQDSQGADALPDLAAWVGLTTKYIVIDGTSVEVTLDNYTARADRYDLEIAKAGTLFADLAAATTIVLSDGPSSPVPLAEDDILQWNSTHQQFRPAQLPETIAKATLQAEVAAASDFADFQSRIAAL